MSAKPIRRRERRGLSILETVVGAAMLAAALSIAAQTIMQFQRHGRATANRAAALTAVENLMEQWIAQPWEDVDEEHFRSLALPEAMAAKLPQAKLTGSVTAVGEPVEAKRLTVSLTTNDKTLGRPITLTTWIYRQPQR